MGRFTYGENHTRMEIDDRALAHLQHAMGIKLRRGEPFFFSWNDDATVGSGRRTVWIHPGANLEFTYHGSRQPRLNPHWVERLVLVAGSSQGLHLIPEPAVGAARFPAVEVGVL